MILDFLVILLQKTQPKLLNIQKIAHSILRLLTKKAKCDILYAVNLVYVSKKAERNG